MSKTGKLTTGKVVDSLGSVGSVFAGAMTSRIISEKLGGILPNQKMKHAILTLVSLVGMGLLNRRDSVQALTQDALIGFSSTQLNALVKEFLKDKDTQEVKEGVLKTGLGSLPLGDYYPYEVEPTKEEPKRVIEFRA